MAAKKRMKDGIDYLDDRAYIYSFSASKAKRFFGGQTLKAWATSVDALLCHRG